MGSELEIRTENGIRLMVYVEYEQQNAIFTLDRISRGLLCIDNFNSYQLNQISVNFPGTFILEICH